MINYVILHRPFTIHHNPLIPMIKIHMRNYTYKICMSWLKIKYSRIWAIVHWNQKTIVCTSIQVCNATSNYFIFQKYIEEKPLKMVENDLSRNFWHFQAFFEHLIDSIHHLRIIVVKSPKYSGFCRIFVKYT